MSTVTILIHETAANCIDRAIGYFSGTAWHTGLRRRKLNAEQAAVALAALRVALEKIDPTASVHEMRNAQMLNHAIREIKRATAKIEA